MPLVRTWTLSLPAIAALAWVLEVGVRNARTGTPVYRRHLLLFAGVALVGSMVSGHWLAAPAGAALGLGLSCLPLAWRRWMRTLSWQRGRARRPDPSVPLILVADPHWREDLTGLREATLRNPEADWLFLGDIFDVWVGRPGMGPPLQAEFLAWVGKVGGKFVILLDVNHVLAIDEMAALAAGSGREATAS